ncbi:MAG TPA: DNA polymerase Y family protein [Bacteroidia bacterium]|jgi:protein ImuB|nr:DNA polymerase Y family protein [Bacteroidia bacterium]
MTRILAIVFPHLMTDWILRRQPELKDVPFVLAIAERGRRVVKAVNSIAQTKGVYTEMVVADCKAIVPELQVLDYDAAQPQKLLTALAEWCIRYAPIVSIDLPNGLLLDSSGCTHLWGGEEMYLKTIQERFQKIGYSTQLAISDTIGCSWGVCRFGKISSIVPSGKQAHALSSLPPTALRLEEVIVERLQKLGLQSIQQFSSMPRTALRRRFGAGLLTRLDQAMGNELEFLLPVKPISPYEERLPSMEPILTATGIELALKQVLETLCQRLSQENKGLRVCAFICHRLDGTSQTIEVGTNRPSRNPKHLFNLFEIKIQEIEPDLGIELFVLQAPVVEELQNTQDALWAVNNANEAAIAELLDRIAGKTGTAAIHRYLPTEHYWPERSIQSTTSLTEKKTSDWRTDLPRPLHMLAKPEPIEVSVPIPDYPPLLFNYKGVLHTVKKADGPERIEQEWWTDKSEYRDYYCLEDEHGGRYWVFRLGDYFTGDPKWFIHGFFA